MLLGCIADDLTGATDLANVLVRAGMRTIQTVGVPPAGVALDDVDAVVVALKSRTIPAAEAVAFSLASLAWLRERGARQIFFKYCSTFDSTDAGNIGPVADALRDALGTAFTIVCPAFPENRRTIYFGNLFVDGVPLAESSMRHHPLTPMTDANLVRVLARQTRARVGLVPFPVVRDGAGAIRRACDALAAGGVAYGVVDALEDAHLHAIGAACADAALVTGGSGVAIGLPENFRRAALLPRDPAPPERPHVGGGAAVLAGSCSAATLEQIATMERTHRAFAIDPLALAGDAPATVASALKWAGTQLAHGPALIYTSQPPDAVARTQAALGREAAAALIEDALAAIARGLAGLGVRRFVVAGGETSGAVVAALNVHVLRIGEQIAPGVPWTTVLDGPPLALALKSGNFGGADFFARALEMTA
jgi:3-dehydrotetronate 4-kinase